jgi:hypothetical protein
MAPKKKSRGMGFSKQELFALLDVIEEHLPVAQNDWDLVEADHTAMYPDSLRTRDSLKRKFVSLYRSKVPTGDPKCPPEVRRAKFILEEIKKKVDLSEGEEGLDVGDEEEEDAISSAAGYTRNADGNHTGTASDGDFDGDGDNLSGGEDDEDEGEEMSLRGASNSTNDIVAPNRNEVNESVHRVPTVARTAASLGSSSVGSRSSNGGGNAATRRNTSNSTSTIFGSSDRNRISRTGSKRARRHADNDDDISIQQLMKMSFMQREQDRADRQVEERLRRDEMRQNQQFLQQMMMTMMFTMGNNTATSNRNQENASSNNEQQQDEDRHQDP